MVFGLSGIISNSFESKIAFRNVDEMMLDLWPKINTSSDLHLRSKVYNPLYNFHCQPESLWKLFWGLNICTIPISSEMVEVQLFLTYLSYQIDFHIEGTDNHMETRDFQELLKFEPLSCRLIVEPAGWNFSTFFLIIGSSELHFYTVCCTQTKFFRLRRAHFCEPMVVRTHWSILLFITSGWLFDAATDLNINGLLGNLE